MNNLRTVEFGKESVFPGTYIHIDDYNAVVAESDKWKNRLEKLTIDIDKLITKFDSIEKKLSDLVRLKEEHEQFRCGHIGYGG